MQVSRPLLRPGWWGAPFVPAYAAAVLLRRFAFNRGLLASRVPPCFTVAVGGLEAGGTGKTPVTGLLLGAFLAGGRRPGLLTRGYGRATHGLALRALGQAARASEVGDEPSMLVASGLDVPIAACAERARGAAALAGKGCDVLVLDDGFAHRYLGRDIDIVVLRGERPLGNGHLLPWGTLREPPSSLARAHIVWLHFRDACAEETAAARLAAASALLERYARSAILVLSHERLLGARDLTGEPRVLAGVRVVGAAGIAHPMGFARTLAAAGAEVASFVSLADHHAYSPADVRRLAALAAASRAAAVVVTAKDAVKLAPLWQGPPLWVVDIAVDVRHGAAALGAALRLSPTLFAP